MAKPVIKHCKFTLVEEGSMPVVKELTDLSFKILSVTPLTFEGENVSAQKIKQLASLLQSFEKLQEKASLDQPKARHDVHGNTLDDGSVPETNDSENLIDESLESFIILDPMSESKESTSSLQQHFENVNGQTAPKHHVSECQPRVHCQLSESAKSEASCSEYNMLQDKEKIPETCDQENCSDNENNVVEEELSKSFSQLSVSKGQTISSVPAKQSQNNTDSLGEPHRQKPNDSQDFTENLRLPAMLSQNNTDSLGELQHQTPNDIQLFSGNKNVGPPEKKSQKNTDSMGELHHQKPNDSQQFSGKDNVGPQEKKGQNYTESFGEPHHQTQNDSQLFSGNDNVGPPEKKGQNNTESLGEQHYQKPNDSQLFSGNDNVGPPEKKSQNYPQSFGEPHHQKPNDSQLFSGNDNVGQPEKKSQIYTGESLGELHHQMPNHSQLFSGNDNVGPPEKKGQNYPQSFGEPHHQKPNDSQLFSGNDNVGQPEKKSQIYTGESFGEPHHQTQNDSQQFSGNDNVGPPEKKGQNNTESLGEQHYQKPNDSQLFSGNDNVGPPEKKSQNYPQSFGEPHHQKPNDSQLFSGNDNVGQPEKKGQNNTESLGEQHYQKPNDSQLFSGNDNVGPPEKKSQNYPQSFGEPHHQKPNDSQLFSGNDNVGQPEKKSQIYTGESLGELHHQMPNHSQLFSGNDNVGPPEKKGQNYPQSFGEPHHQKPNDSQLFSGNDNVGQPEKKSQIYTGESFGEPHHQTQNDSQLFSGNDNVGPPEKKGQNNTESLGEQHYQKPNDSQLFSGNDNVGPPEKKSQNYPQSFGEPHHQKPNDSQLFSGNDNVGQPEKKSQIYTGESLGELHHQMPNHSQLFSGNDNVGPPEKKGQNYPQSFGEPHHQKPNDSQLFSGNDNVGQPEKKSQNYTGESFGEPHHQTQNDSQQFSGNDNVGPPEKKGQNNTESLGEQHYQKPNDSQLFSGNDNVGPPEKKSQNYPQSFGEPHHQKPNDSQLFSGNDNVGQPEKKSQIYTGESFGEPHHQTQNDSQQFSGNDNVGLVEKSKNYSQSFGEPHHQKPNDSQLISGNDNVSPPEEKSQNNAKSLGDLHHQKPNESQQFSRSDNVSPPEKKSQNNTESLRDLHQQKQYDLQHETCAHSGSMSTDTLSCADDMISQRTNKVEKSEPQHENGSSVEGSYLSLSPVKYNFALKYFHKNRDFQDILKKAEPKNEMIFIKLQKGNETQDDFKHQLDQIKTKKQSCHPSLMESITSASFWESNKVVIEPGNTDNEIVITGMSEDIRSVCGKIMSLNKKFDAESASKTVSGPQSTLKGARSASSNQNGARPKDFNKSSSVDPFCTNFPNETKVFNEDKTVKIVVKKADITKLRVDCIVNAANKHLNHGGGVAKVIASAAGERLITECREHIGHGNRVETTNIFVSTGGNLEVCHVFHAVGPKWYSYDDNDKGKCEKDLRQTILRCLAEAVYRKMTSIAFPSISAAIFRVPKDICAKNYVQAAKNFTFILADLKEMFPTCYPENFEISFVDIDQEMVRKIQERLTREWKSKPHESELEEDKQFVIDHILSKQTKQTQGSKGSGQKESTKVRSSTPNEPLDYLMRNQLTVSIRTGHATDFRADCILLIGDLFKEVSGLSNFSTTKGVSEIKTSDDPSVKLCSLHKPGSSGSDKLMCLVKTDFENLKDKQHTLLDTIKRGLVFAECCGQLDKDLECVVVTSSCLYPSKGGKNNQKTVGKLSEMLFNLIDKSTGQGDKPPLSANKIIIAASHEWLPVVCKVFDSRLEKYPGMIKKVPRTASHMEPKKDDRQLQAMGGDDRFQTRQRMYPKSNPSYGYTSRMEPKKDDRQLQAMGGDDRFQSRQRMYPKSDPSYGYTSRMEPKKDDRQLQAMGGDDRFQTPQRMYQESDPSYGHTEARGSHLQQKKECSICCENLVDHQFHCCGAWICKVCLSKMPPQCPFCKQVYGILMGNQPKEGIMECYYSFLSLPGYEYQPGYFTITYRFGSGIQQEDHPNPGKRYRGILRTAYLPFTEEGCRVLVLLRVAFFRRLTFTIGTSNTTGVDDQIVWNNIHHKTNIYGGSTNFGYPDPYYTQRVLMELDNIGVTLDSMMPEELRDVRYFLSMSIGRNYLQWFPFVK